MAVRAINDLHVVWADGEVLFCRGRREAGDGNQAAVLVVVPAAVPLTPGSLERLKHEYGLKDALDGGWAVRPLEIVHEYGRTLLVLEDCGGESLGWLLGSPMEVGTFLRLAIGIATTLGKVHQRGLIHKDLKPAHILVDRASGAVRFTGFGIASRLLREHQAPEPPEVIAGTLAYMAPEQTGRMNRSVDARSDLYALGVTLYEMLTGALPFTAAAPMEWVHCHIARQPLRPSERVPGIPGQLKAVVMKLLAKTPEDRYQTAAGVTADLRRCLAAWEAHERIAPFSLGRRDVPDQLLLPETLYGREREVALLLAACDRVVTHGTPELVLVSGAAGIGKSAVVYELHKALVPRSGLFAAVLHQTYPPGKRGMAMGIFMAGMSFGPAIGPSLSGYLVEHLSRRAVFYIKLPIGLVALMGAAIVTLPEGESSQHKRLDLLGLATMTTFVVSLLLAVRDKKRITYPKQAGEERYPQTISPNQASAGGGSQAVSWPVLSASLPSCTLW